MQLHDDREVHELIVKIIRSIGPWAAAGERVTHARKEGKLGNIYRLCFQRTYWLIAVTVLAKMS